MDLVYFSVSYYQNVLYNLTLYTCIVFFLFFFILLIMFFSWRRKTFLVDVERSIVQLIADFAFSRVHLVIRSISWLNGYKDFSEEECNKNIVIVSICTNGLGHIHQAIRVLTVLKEKSNFKAAAIVVAKRSKLPAYANVFLEEYGCREIIDLDFELDYEGGGNNGKDNRINNVNIMFMFCYSMLFHGVRIFRTVGNVMQTYRPGVLLSFFEPIFANFINSHDNPTKIITAASQGSLNIEQDDLKKVLFFRLLWHANVGRKGRIIPFCQYPLENAIPQIVNLPSSNSEYVKSTVVEVGLGRHVSAESGNTMPFLVAYSCMPMVLIPGIIRIRRHRVILFSKNHMYWAKKCEKYKNILVLPRSPDFIDALACSAGLISQPSRGVVTQAIALGKPVYLFCPKGHVEQELNYKLYLSQYEGIGSPSTVTIEKWEKTEYNLVSQAQRMRSWLSQTDERIMRKIGSFLPLNYENQKILER